MPSTTTPWLLPYPVPQDPADVPSDMSALANRLNTVLSGPAGGDLAGNYPDPTLGAQGLGRVLALAGATGLAASFGAATVTIASGANYGFTTVTHALGRVPQYVLATARESGADPITVPKIAEAQDGTMTTTTFNLFLYITEANPAVAFPSRVDWMAVG